MRGRRLIARGHQIMIPIKSIIHDILVQEEEGLGELPLGIAMLAEAMPLAAPGEILSCEKVRFSILFFAKNMLLTMNFIYYKRGRLLHWKQKCLTLGPWIPRLPLFRKHS